MNYNIQVNLNQIRALRNARVKSSRNQEILNKRVAQAGREIQSLRHFAAKKPGRVANYCNGLADYIESQLSSI